MTYIFKTLSIHRVSLHRLDDFLFNFKGTFSYCSADSDRVLRYIYCSTSQLERALGWEKTKMHWLIFIFSIINLSINVLSWTVAPHFYCNINVQLSSLHYSLIKLCRCIGSNNVPVSVNSSSICDAEIFL